MENAGIVCIRSELGYTKMDGVSYFSECGRPYVFIAADKANCTRNRFDAAHELGHLILHRKVTEDQYYKNYRLIEDQANFFAGEFLMPETSFSQDVSHPTLDGFLSIKTRWKTSVASMIVRAYQLGIIDDDQKLRLFKGRSARGWATREPYDDEPSEQPRLMHRSVKMLVDGGYISKDSFLNRIALPPDICDQLCNLEGYFVHKKQQDNLLTLKIRQPQNKNTLKTGQIIELNGRRNLKD